MERKLAESIDKLTKVQEGYSLNSSKDTLNELLEIYQIINPDWTKEYNRREDEKLQYRNTKSSVLNNLILNKLPEGFDTSKLKSKRKIGKDDEPIDPIELGRIIHIANKISHTYEQKINSIITEYIMKESKNGRDFVGNYVATKNGRIVNRKFEKDLKSIYKISNEVQKEYQDPIDECIKVEKELKNKRQKAKKVRNEIIDELEKYEKCGVSVKEFTNLFSLRRNLKILEVKGKNKTENYYELLKESEELMAEITKKVPRADVEKLEKKTIRERKIRKEISQIEAEHTRKKEELDKKHKHNVIARRRKYFMEDYGFTQKDFEYLDSQGLQKMWRAHALGMNIKDMAIEDVNRIVQERNLQEISYGITEETDEKGSGKKLFYMDIPEFGQFSVHFMPAVISSSKFPEYTMSFGKRGRREQIMLTDQYSKDFKELIEDTYQDSECDDLIGLEEVLEDGTRVPKNGVIVSEERKEQYRKIYQILFLDLGNKKSELEVRKSIRHQLGVSISLPKEFLKCLHSCDTCEDLAKRVEEIEFSDKAINKSENANEERE